MKKASALILLFWFAIPLTLWLCYPIADAQVAGVCGAGRACRARNFVATTPGTGQVAYQMPNLDVIQMGSCALQTNGSNLLVGSPSACSALFSGGHSLSIFGLTIGPSTYQAFEGYASASVLPSPTLRGFAADTASNRIWVANNEQWTQIGGGSRPVKGGITFVAGTDRLAAFGAFPLRWITAPISNGAAIGMTTIGTVSTSSNNGCPAIGGCPGPTYFTVHTSGAVIGDRAGNHSSATYASSGSYFATRVGFTTLTNRRVFAGISGTLPLAAGTATPTAQAAVFRYDTSAGDTQWQACTGSGVAITCTNTNVTVSATGVLNHLLEIDCREYNSVGTVTACTFWVDGQARVRRTTSLPSGATGHLVTMETLAASPVQLNIDTIEVETR